MKKRLIWMSILMAVFVLFFATLPVMAAPLGQEATQRPDALSLILDLALGFGGLVGVAGLITVVVNLLKLVGWVADGTSATWIAILNLAAFGILVGVRLFNPAITSAIMDEQAAKLAQVGVFILGYLTQILSSKQIYGLIKGLPVIGKSFSG